MHEQRTGKSAPPNKVVLVFSNKNLEWEPLPPEVDAEAYDEMGFINMVEKMNKSAPDDALKETLLGFGTWDTIYMNGGQTIIGDIIEYPYEKKNCSIDHTGILGLITGPKSTLSTGQEVTDQSGPLVLWLGKIMQELFHLRIFLKSNLATLEPSGVEVKRATAAMFY